MSKKKEPNIIHKYIAPFLAHTFIRLILVTCRLSITNVEVFEKRKEEGKNMIFVSWHSRLLVLPYYYRYRYGFKDLTMMVSQSRDGEMFKRLLEKFDIETVRGSATRGGMSAIKTLVRVTRNGRDTAIGLDGSKGPAFKVQPGALLLSQMTGVPLLPIIYDATRKIVLNTWDKMIIPLPFSRIHVTLGDFIHVPREAKDLEPYQQKLQKIMDEIFEHCSKQVEN